MKFDNVFVKFHLISCNCLLPLLNSCRILYRPIRVSFSFLPKGIIGGASTYLCAKHVETRGVQGHAPLGNFDFGPFIRRNLVQSGTVFLQIEFTIFCH